MARPGKHKAKYDKWKNSGHLQRNKQLKKERDEKRRLHFQIRREEGKTYQYKPNPYKKDTSEYLVEAFERAAKNKQNKTETQRITSVMRKLDNELENAIKENKRKEGKRQPPRKRIAPLGDDEVSEM